MLGYAFFSNVVAWRKYKASLQLINTKISKVNVSVLSATVHAEFPVEIVANML